MPPISYPLINGVRPDFSSVQFALNGLVFNGFQGVKYKNSLKPGILRGNRAQKIGRTRGVLDSDGELMIWRDEYAQLLIVLTSGGLGYMEQSFDLVVMYSEPTTPDLFTTDLVLGCRIIEDDHDMKEGGDPLVVKCALDVMSVLPNEVTPISPAVFLQ